MPDNSNAYNHIGRIGNKSLMPKLTKQQFDLVERRLDELEEHGDEIPLDIVGLKLADDHKSYSLYEVQKRGDYTYKNMRVPRNRILAQHDVRIKDMRTILNHYARLPLPDMVRLQDGHFWVGEGHHRMYLMILAGLPITANVQIRPKETASESTMRNSKIIQLAIKNNKETAATDVMQMGDSPAVDNVLMELYRANKLLDERNKERLFFEHLSIGSKTTAQRALQAYDEDYLLRLNMSLASIQELTQALISAVAYYKLTPSPAWSRIAGGTFNLAVMDGELEEAEDNSVDSERVSADI